MNVPGSCGHSLNLWLAGTENEETDTFKPGFMSLKLTHLEQPTYCLIPEGRVKNWLK